jgi:hypothetical protein
MRRLLKRCFLVLLSGVLISSEFDELESEVLKVELAETD